MTEREKRLVLEASVIGGLIADLAAALESACRDRDRIQKCAQQCEHMLADWVGRTLPPESDGTPCWGGRSVMLHAKSICEEVVNLRAERDELKQRLEEAEKIASEHECKFEATVAAIASLRSPTRLPPSAPG